MEAAKAGSLQLVRAILKEGGDPNALDRKRFSAVHYAAIGGVFEVLCLLRLLTSLCFFYFLLMNCYCKEQSSKKRLDMKTQKCLVYSTFKYPIFPNDPVFL